MTHRFMVTVIALLTFSSPARGQGPLASYFFDPSTELSWASCRVYFEGGSSLKVPFMPLVSPKRAPLGTEKYTRDVRVDAPLVFVGDGIVRPGSPNPYEPVDVAGKVVLLTYDAHGSAITEADSAMRLETRVREAAARKPAAIVAFSVREDSPFPFFRDDEATGIPEVGAIVIGRKSAEEILAAAGLRLETVLQEWKSNGTFAPQALIARLAFRIDGAFASEEGPNFTMMFQPGMEAARRQELLTLNERSVAFVLKLFASARVTWRKSFVAYFRDFDAKVFYTHHWGRGLASDAGVFNVLDPNAISYGLAVHENTHTLLGESWGNSSSFFSEGLARYAESMATTPGRDHLEAVGFLKNDALVPLTDLLGIDIGSDPRTEVAYPAAGSLVGYLTATYGLQPVRRAYELEARDEDVKARDDTWTRAFKRPLTQIERDWTAWLRARFLQQ